MGNTISTVRDELERGSKVRLPVLDEAHEIDRGSSRLKQQQAVDPKAVLAELFELLEDYGPGWYTEVHHNRAVAALHAS